MTMTWKKLAEVILELPEEKQNKNVTIFDHEENEFHGLLQPLLQKDIFFFDDGSVLDEDQPYVILDRCSGEALDR